VKVTVGVGEKPANTPPPTKPAIPTTPLEF
jgi:hypothetical protein